MLSFGVDNPLISMAASDLVNFGKKFFNSAKTHQINEIEKDIAISNRSAQAVNDLKSASKEVVPTIPDVFNSSLGSVTAQKPSYSSGGSAYSVSASPVTPKSVDYLNAELAKHYGMNRSTAYQEALTNTAYQRAVQDMKAAGLNPAAIFGSGKGYTAGGVAYAGTDEPMSFGGSSGSGRSSGSNDKLFSEGAYHAISTAVGLVGMKAMNKGPIGYYISETAAKSVMGALNEIFR